jgi:hydrogenase 3 maturation protease
MEPLESLRQVLAQRTMLVGIGNPLRGDDGVGPYIVELVRRRCASPRLEFLNVEDVPENFAFRIAAGEARNVVFVDAVIAGRAPEGTVLFAPLEEFDEVGETASTHKLALKLSGRVLEDAGKKVYLLGIVPKTTAVGAKLTPEVRRTALRLGRLILSMSQGPEAP